VLTSGFINKEGIHGVMYTALRKLTRKSDTILNNALSQNKLTKPLYRKIVSGEVSVGQYQIYIPPIRVGIIDREIDQFIQDKTKNRVFWDIGANIGYYSVLASEYAEHVCAFEPEPNNYNILNKNVKNNNINNIETLEVAVSNENGQAELYREPIQGGGIHSLAKDERLTDKPCSVKVKTVDTLIKNHKSPDLIKVDVEGAEQKVLEGSTKTIQECDTEWLIEIHSPRTVPETENNTNRLKQHGGDIVTIYDLLNDNGYQILGVQGNEIVNFDIEGDDIPLYWYAKK